MDQLTEDIKFNKSLKTLVYVLFLFLLVSDIFVWLCPALSTTLNTN